MANTPDKPTTGYSTGPYCRGYDGTDPQTLKVDSDGHPQVDVLSAALPTGAATEAKQDDQITALGLLATEATAATLATEATAATLALESGGNLATIAGKDFATETTQATLALESGGNLASILTAANAGYGAPRIRKSATVASYDGSQIEVTGLTASTEHDLLSLGFRLTGGTVGNATQPSLGIATGFTEGDEDTVVQISASIAKDAAKELDVFVQPIPFVSDANGKVYIKGAAPGSADSSLWWEVVCVERR